MRILPIKKARPPSRWQLWQDMDEATLRRFAMHVLQHSPGTFDRAAAYVADLSDSAERGGAA